MGGRRWLALLLVLLVVACTATLQIGAVGSDAADAEAGSDDVSVPCTMDGGGDAGAADAHDGGEASLYTVAPPPMAIVVVGDSESDEYASTTYSHVYGYAGLSWVKYLNPAAGEIVNASVTGNTCAQMLARATLDGGIADGLGNGWAYRGTTYPRRAFIPYCGVNNTAVPPLTAAEEYELICQMADVARPVMPTRVIGVTPLTVGAAMPAPLRTILGELAALIRARAPSPSCVASHGGDASACPPCLDDVVDLAADTDFVPTNTLLYRDHQHLAPPGIWLEAHKHFQPAIERAWIAP